MALVGMLREACPTSEDWSMGFNKWEGESIDVYIYFYLYLYISVLEALR